MPSRPIATRKTPAIFMITMSRCTRGRFLIVWISCLYVIRGALRAFSTVGGVAGSVIPHPPPEYPIPRWILRWTPWPLPAPVPGSEEAKESTEESTEESDTPEEDEG